MATELSLTRERLAELAELGNTLPDDGWGPNIQPCTENEYLALIAMAMQAERERDALRVVLTDAVDHYSGATRRCVDCRQKHGEGHAEWCYVPKMIAALAEPDAGGDAS